MPPVFQFNSKNRFYKFLICTYKAGLKSCIINLYHIRIDEFVFAMQKFFWGGGGGGGVQKRKKIFVFGFLCFAVLFFTERTFFFK